MRAFVAAASLTALACLPAKGDVPCREYWRGPHIVEWVEQGAQHGARIVARDPKWQLSGMGRFATTRAACETCSHDQIGAGVLWLSAGDTSGRNLEQAVAPEIVARIMAPFPFQVAEALVHATADSIPMSVAGLEGRARAIDIDYRDGRSRHVIAFSAVKDACLILYGILHTWDGAEVAADRIEAFASAIDVESYAPKPNPYVLNPPPNLGREDFPLGDAFQRRRKDDRIDDQ